MVKVSGPIRLEIIPGSRGRFYRLTEKWGFYCDTLGCWSWAPEGFVYDLESTPGYKGENPMAGTGHDLVCRSDFKPEINKVTAALVYNELASFEDGHWTERNIFQRFWDWITNKVKRNVVIVAPGYFQVHPINATYEEMSGIE